MMRLALLAIKIGAVGFFFLVVLMIATNFSLYIATSPYIYEEVAHAPKAQVALVPGAAIYSDGSLSPVFVDRIDLASALYKAQKVEKILVSGDNSTDTYNEVNPARLYLIEQGIPDEDIYLDHAGFDTYSTMYRARDIFGVVSILIATQEFHLPRAVFIARTLGIDAYGVDPQTENLLMRNNIREAFATEKAVLDLFLKREPKFLGDKIPIGGKEQTVE